ncbi:DNA-methyltransferase [Methylobacterium mesophilicum]
MSSESFLNGRITLHAGDMLAVLDTLPENSVDSVVCDPPYHLTSIVKRFGAAGAAACQHGTDGAFKRATAGFMGKQWDGGDIAFRVETWAKVLRVLKPGGYILAFSSSRTFGRMSVAIEDAGFITQPMIGWIFGSGFPKAHRIKTEGYDGFRYGGQAMKPALEPIYLGQKPFSESTGTANVLRWGTGAINIDGCRIGTTRGVPASHSKTAGAIGAVGIGARRLADELDPNRGRYPANLIHDGSDEVVAAFPEAPCQQRGVGPQHGAKPGINCYGDFGAREQFDPRGDAGSAARFFYSAKADSDDRLGSKHPTVKPLDLIQYLVRLVTPPGGLVLDCFAGTGTTGEAAWREGMSAVLIERDPEYQTDIRRRMALCLAGPDERRRAIVKAKSKPDDLTGTLFASTEVASC